LYICVPSRHHQVRPYRGDLFVSEKRIVILEQEDIVREEAAKKNIIQQCIQSFKYIGERWKIGLNIIERKKQKIRG
jgi:hypothetical protein